MDEAIAMVMRDHHCVAFVQLPQSDREILENAVHRYQQVQ